MADIAKSGLPTLPTGEPLILTYIYFFIFTCCSVLHFITYSLRVVHQHASLVASSITLCMSLIQVSTAIATLIKTHCFSQIIYTGSVRFAVRMTGIESEAVFDVLKSLDPKVFFFADYLTI